MFYCPNCNNAFDITRSIESKQIGGKKENPPSSSSTSDSSEAPTGDNSFITKLLTNKATTNDVSKIDLPVFVKSGPYRDLSNEDKETVYNKIQDLLPNDKKKLMEFKNNVDEQANTAYFICTNCGHARKIDNGTLIFSRKSENITQSYNVGDYADLKYSNVLPRTRNYVCVNDKCASHKELGKREAIFFRVGGYNIKYMCVTCETIF